MAGRIREESADFTDLRRFSYGPLQICMLICENLRINPLRLEIIWMARRQGEALAIYNAKR